LGDDARAIDDLVRAVEGGELVAIVGPTASGKTELACQLAERTSGEVVSVDSVQIYERFDVGSGKPSADELARAPHHLVGTLDARDPAGGAVDAARYATLAGEAIDGVKARGKRPILCGGTFLWMKALVHGLAEAPPGDPGVRARHEAIVHESGKGELHRMLAAVDPAAAARLHVNDVLRVGRALEVFELTGRTMTAVQSEHRFQTKRYPARFVARAVDPAELTRRIAARVERWLAIGWVDEVARLLADGYGDTRPMGSVGYREVSLHVRGELAASALAETIVRSTRVFARRQRTWLRSADVTWM
jgi:tRNA dimethylallyltransferase